MKIKERRKSNFSHSFCNSLRAKFCVYQYLLRTVIQERNRKNCKTHLHIKCYSRCSFDRGNGDCSQKATARNHSFASLRCDVGGLLHEHTLVQLSWAVFTSSTVVNGMETFLVTSAQTPTTDSREVFWETFFFYFIKKKFSCALTFEIEVSQCIFSFLDMQFLISFTTAWEMARMSLCTLLLKLCEEDRP